MESGFRKPAPKLKLSELPCSKLAENKRRRHIMETSNVQNEMDLLDETLKDLSQYKELHEHGFSSTFEDYLGFVNYLKLIRSYGARNDSYIPEPRTPRRFGSTAPSSVSSTPRSSHSEFGGTPSRSSSDPQHSLSFSAGLDRSLYFSMTPTRRSQFSPSRSDSPSSVLSGDRMSISSIRAPKSENPLKFEQDWIKRLKEKVDSALKIKVIEKDIETPTFEKLIRKTLDLDKKFSKVQTDNFPTLTTEILKKVEGAFSIRTGPIVSAFNIEITLDDISRLKPGQWLNDQIINFYGNLIMKRASDNEKAPKIHFFNTYFYSLLKEHGFEKVKRWTRKFNLFSMDIIVFPVHLGVHWCCGVIDIRAKRIEYYDSLHGLDSAYFKTVRDYLKREAESKNSNFNSSEWEDYCPKNIPAQENGYDCGVFSCCFAEYRSRDASFDFSQKHMPYMRKRMIYEIISENLLLKF